MTRERQAPNEMREARELRGRRDILREGGFGRGPRDGRRRRGDVRPLLLAGLIEGPTHGYDLIRRLEERADGQWRPSAGSVYPTLQLLEDEGLVRSSEIEGRKVYELTEEGTAQADESAFDRLSQGAGRGEHRPMRDELHQLVLAWKQVDRVGDPAQLEEATAVMRKARQSLYRLLAGEADA